MNYLSGSKGDPQWWVSQTIIIIIIYVMELGHLLTRSGLTYQKPLQRSAMIPSASWGIAFHYPG